MIPCSIMYKPNTWVAGYYYLQTVIDGEGIWWAIVVNEKGFVTQELLNSVQLDMSSFDDEDDDEIYE